MKSVGIITFWDSKDNYGQLLQNFALIRFLENLNYQAKLIKVENYVRRDFIYKVKKIFHFLGSPKKLYKKLLSEKMKKTINIENQKYTRHFDDFRNKYIPSTDYILMTDLFSSPPFFDAYITGSDQVWNSLFPLYFLKFVPPRSKKIAYAASMGGFKPNGEKLAVLKEFVSDFDYVSLREKQALNFFKQNNICNAECTPDPTLLLSKNDYKSLYKTKKTEKPYILLYLLGNKSTLDIAKIYKYAESKNLNVIYVASQGKYDNYEKHYPTIEEWLSLIENASMIVTNSFHGTIFSIIYRKKFATLLLNGPFAEMNDRIIDMLEKYGLKKRIFTTSIEDYEEDVDYSIFEKISNIETTYVKNKLLNVIG